MNIFWPPVDTKEDAKKACGYGAGAAFLASGVTALIAILNETGVWKNPFGIGMGAMLDAGAFLILGILICFCSRIASLLALGLFIFERIDMMRQTGSFSYQSIFLLCAYIAAVRGSFAYHELKNLDNDPPPTAPVQPVSIFGKKDPALTPETSEKAPSKWPMVLILFLIISLAGAGFWAWRSGKLQTLIPQSTGQVKNNRFIQDVQSGFKTGFNSVIKGPSKNIKFAAPTPGNSDYEYQAQGPEKTFKLVSGATVHGKVLTDDPDYYTIETSGGKQEIVIKSDVASESEPEPAVTKP